MGLKLIGWLIEFEEWDQDWPPDHPPRNVSIFTKEKPDPPYFSCSSPLYAIVKKFPGEYEHRINLCDVKEELVCIGDVYARHSDLPGRFVSVGRWRRWSRASSAALSFPASLMVGPIQDDGIPF